MKQMLKVVTEIDFVTCGVKPRGELLLRASNVLLDTEKLKTQLDRRDDNPLEAACRLVQKYVKCQDVLFKPHRVNVEDWLAKRLVWTLMNACLQCPLRTALEFRNQIEDAAGSSELYAVALGIIDEYETYCSHMAEIAKHVEAHRKIIDSNRS
ncbi:MAG: hypothetical protein WCD76_08070, partial [Pyrinomonadaceae bacterium]